MAISSQTLPFFLWKATEGYHIDIRILQQDLLLCGSSPSEDFEVSDSTTAGTGIFPISPSRAIVFSRAKKEHLEPIILLSDKDFSYVSNQRAFLNGDFVISSRSDFYGSSLVEVPTQEPQRQ